MTLCNAGKLCLQKEWKLSLSTKNSENKECFENKNFQCIQYIQSYNHTINTIIQSILYIQSNFQSSIKSADSSNEMKNCTVKI